MSNVSSYQSEIETKFNSFLNNQGVSDKTISNYCSDVRYFMDWVTTNNASMFSDVQSPSAFFSLITPELLSAFRDTQVTIGIPTSTINRRLSSIRMLFKWATDAGVTFTNPTQTLRNINTPIDVPAQTMEGMLGAFEQSLRLEGAADSTIKNYVSDVQQFLIWNTQKYGSVHTQ
jgi:site-specific recombinase XerD